MKERTTRSLLRSVALVGAVAAGATAFGGTHYEWTPTDTTYWDDAANWATAEYDGADYRLGNNGNEVKFRTAETVSIGVLFYNGTHTFVADEAAYGLSGNDLNVWAAPWWSNATDVETVLNIGSGTYSFDNVYVNLNTETGGKSATLNLNGGTLTATDQVSLDGGTVTLNGGTLSAASVSGTGTLAVGTNGGTLNMTSADAEVEIAVALSGSGTLTKTGTAPLSFTGNVSAFKGKIAVAEGAGAVTLAGVTVAAGEEVQFGAYTWVGGGADNKWSTLDNWRVNGAVPTAPPAADSTVVIPEGDGTELTVVCNGTDGDYTGYLTIKRDVKFARVDSSHTGMHITAVYGEGKTLTIANNFTLWCAIKGVQPEISANLNIGNNTLTLANGGSGDNKFGSAIKLTGAFLSGDRGSVTCSTQVGGLGLEFYGDTSGFYGTYNGSGFKTGSNEYIDGTRFGAAIDGSNANWSFGQKHEHNNNGNWTPFLVGNATYKFGSINSISDCFTFCSYHTSKGDTFTENVTVEFGAKGDSTIKGDIRGTGNKLVKVGASTKADITLTTTGGEIDAQEGTVNILGTVAPAAVKFAGTGATIKIARTTTTTTTVEPEEEGGEATTTTTTTENIPSTFVPGFSDDLAGYQYEVAQETTDGVTYDVYTVVKVAKDSADNEYYSVAAALDAIAADETLEKTITLTHDYDTAVALPLGYSLFTAGYSCTVTGEAGVGVSYNEETGTYTTVDNTSATWKGDAAGANWADADNWSTGAVPNEGTTVKFTYNALVYISDHDNLAHKCASMDIADGVTMEFAPPEKNYTIYPRVAVYGDINGGKGTLKLWRSGIIEQADGYVNVYPAVQFENPGVAGGETRDSWFQGNYTFRGDVTGTGVLVIYNACTFNNANINVPEGSVVDFRANPTLSHASEKLTGTGTVIVHATPANNSRWKAALQNSTNWQGVTEVQGEINGIDAANFGGTGSTVRFNGVTGYLRASDGSTVEVGNVKTIDIGANGLTLKDKYTTGTGKGYIISAAITGSGTIAFGTQHQETNKAKYIFTGDVSGFTGAINYGTLGSYRACVYFAAGVTSSTVDSLTAPTDYGQIIVESGNTVDVAATWYGAGGWIINGTVNVASTGSLTCDSNGAKIGGTGTISYAAIPANTTALTYNADAWTGSVVLPATEISSKTGIPLAGLSSDNGTLVIKGITRKTSSNSLYLGTGASCTVAGTTQLDGDLHITDGNSNATYTWNKITGTGDILFTTAGGSASGITHAVTTLDNYTGTITAGGNVSLTIGTVAVDAVEVGVPVVKLAADSTLTTDPADIALEVAGEASELTLVKADDGNLYVAVASVTVTPEEGDPVTTPYATYDAAVAAADEAGVTTVSVLYGDGAVNGWDYDSENDKLTKNTTAIARVGATQYDTLAAAFEAATAGDTVVLFGTSADAAALSADGATLEIDTTATYTGTISGNGTVVADVAFTPVFGEWTGTFVVNWAVTGGSNGSPFKPTTYGNANSTVKLAKGATDIYLTNASGTYGDIGTKLYFGGNVSFRNGWGGDSQASTIPQLGADEGVVVTTRQGASTSNATYLNITVLKDFAGSFVVNSGTVTTIGSVELDEIPAFGTKVVNATVASGATSCSIAGKIADGYPLVFKADGLYFDPVAQVGEAYYNTAVEAIKAANGGVVSLVQTTDETYSIAAGETVQIKWNGFGNVVVTAKVEGDTVEDSWNEETGVTTYTCTAQETEGVEPGETVEYDTEAEATAATMAVPEAVAAAVTGVALDQYKLYFKKVVTAPTTEGGKYTVEYVLNDTITGLIETEFAAKLATVDVGSLATAEEATAVTITAAPGLYYGVQSQTSLGSGAPVTTVSSVLATSDTVTVTFPAADDSAQKFFTIFASPTDPAASSAGDDANVGNETGSGAGA